MVVNLFQSSILFLLWLEKEKTEYGPFSIWKYVLFIFAE
jgi:hypothetical protein